MNWFEKFLEEKALTRHEVYVEWLHHSDKENETKVTHVAVRDLGELVWKRFCSLVLELDFPFGFSHWRGCRTAGQGEAKSLFDVCLACLGEKELRKRLEGLE